MQTFLAALRALSRREVQYGSYATSEEVSTWGMGAIVDGELCGCLNGHCKDPCLNNCSVYDLNVC